MRKDKSIKTLKPYLAHYHIFYRFNFKMSSCFIEVSQLLSRNIKINLRKTNFCSAKQVMQLLHNIDVVPISKQTTIVYKPYNWQLQLNNYKNFLPNG